MGTKAWDVVVLDATGSLGAEGHPLRDALVARGLRVKLNIIPERGARSAPKGMFDDARESAYCVTITMADENSQERPGLTTEVTRYVGCLEPGHAPQVRLGEMTVESGTLPRNRQRLVDQIVAYLRPGPESTGS